MTDKKHNWNSKESQEQFNREQTSNQRKLFLVPEETLRKKYKDEDGLFTIDDEIIERILKNSVELTSELEEKIINKSMKTWLPKHFYSGYPKESVKEGYRELLRIAFQKLRSLNV